MRRVSSLSRRVGLASLILTTSACLIEPNPEFVSDERGESGSDAATGGLDVGMDVGMDGMDMDGPEGGTGDCMHPCQFGGETHDCIDGMCVANLELSVLDDADAWEAEPSQNHGTDELLYVSDGGMFGVRNAYVALPKLGMLPQNAEVLRADLYLYLSSEGSPVALHRIEEDWSEEQVDWEAAPSVDAMPLATVPLQLGDNLVDLEPYLSSWDDAPNFGVSLRATSPSLLSIHSSEHPGGRGPRLSLSFRW